MRKFRICWIIIVGLVTAGFLSYNIMEYMQTDDSRPVFTVEGDSLEVSIHDGEEALKKGITAFDAKDGDVTDSVLIEKISNMYDEGRRLVTYVAFDSDHHVSEAEREITYTDYTSPRFELTGSLRFRAGSIINIDEIIKVTDCLDGDLSNNVKIQTESSINNRVTGLFQVVYQVANSAGDTEELPVRFEIYQPADNEGILELTEYLAYYDGSDIDYKNYLKSLTVGSKTAYFDNAAEDVSDESDTFRVFKNQVNIISYVDETVPGVYPVYFYFENDSYVATQFMYVVVE